jgi:DNA (cytosine-5)-methyltransferase 1
MVKLRGTNVGDAATSPMHTASAGGQHHGVVAGFLAQHNGGFNETPGHPASGQLSTITGSGTQQQLVATSLVGFHKSCKHGQACSRPSNAATTKPRLGLVESTLAYGLTEEELAGARRVAKFLRANGVKFEGELATVRGRVMVDIGMRMLMPRELFRAQGFPEEYVIDRAWIVDPDAAHHGRIREVKLTKEEQIRMCGNSVCPKVMRDLVKVNVPYLASWFPEERKGIKALLKAEVAA